MVDGYFPSDGHLQASREQSIFGTRTEAARPLALVVDWVYFGDPWTNDLYKEKLTRFWTLYLQRRGGQLVSLCNDVLTALTGFAQATVAARPPPRPAGLQSTRSNTALLRIGREVGLPAR